MLLDHVMNDQTTFADARRQLATHRSYRIAVFAHNEEAAIEGKLSKILRSLPPPRDLKIHVLANGCTDKTLEKVRAFSRRHPEIIPIELRMPDKCNAWNHYVYQCADDSPCHFFTDGDVDCSDGALPLMHHELSSNEQATAFAGLPLSGRNKETYQKYQMTYGELYGGLYAVKGGYLGKLRQLGIKLPLGLAGNDFLISRLMVTDLGDCRTRHRTRILFHPSAGYQFQPLRPYRLKDVALYLKRLVRYRLRARQLDILFHVQINELPRTMDGINKQVLADLEARGSWLSWPDWMLRRRLRKMYPTIASVYYERMLDEAS
jgi:hypothetical protein